MRSFEKLAVTFLLIVLLAGIAAGQATNQAYIVGQAATMLVGQADFSSTIPGPEAFQLGTPLGLTMAGKRLIVSDGGYLFTVPNNNRVLIFNDATSLFQGPPANVVLGQPAFGFKCGSDSKQSCTIAGAGPNGLNQPVGVTTDGQRLVVADAGNNRVLIFNQIPTTSGASADLVLGQPDFKGTAAGTSQTAFRQPNGVFLFGGRLFVADTLNHRVLIYNTIPTSSNAPADIVLGQADFVSRKQQAASATTLLSPVAVTTDGVRLIVTDLGNNRVLIYNRIPTASGAAADYVVGQPDMTTMAVGMQAGDLNFPRYAYSDGSRLYIADSGNNRLLVFNEVPAWNNATAEVVIGQPGFGDATEGTASERLALPVALAPSASGGVLVSDANNRRVLEFKAGLPLVARGAIVDSASLNGNGLQRPANLTSSVDTGGTIPAGTYYIKVTASSTFPRESTPSDELVVKVPDSSKITVNWDPVFRAASYRVYLGTSSGGQNRFYSTGVANAVAPKLIFAGLPLAGDTTTFTITKSDSTTFTATYTVQAGDDLIKISKNVAAVINGNASNDAHGIVATSDGIDSINWKSKEVGTTGTNCKYLAAATGGLTVSPNTVQSFTAPDATMTAPQPTLTFNSLFAPPSTDFGFDFQAPFNQVVAGSVVTLFGTNLASGTFQAPDFDLLPTEVAGVSVLVNGRAAPLSFVSTAQINFQVPMEVTGNSISVQVRQRTASQQVFSVAIPVNLTFPQPSIYTQNGTGVGIVMARHLDGTVVDNEHAAQLGEAISIFGTGYGLIADTPTNVQTTFTDTGGSVIPGTYYIRVTTIFPDGRESLGSGETQITASTGGTNKVSLTWDAVDGAARYRVYVGTRALGYDRFYETTTKSFDVVSIFGAPGAPPVQTNILGDGRLQVATTFAAIMLDQNMDVLFKGLAPGQVGIWRTDLTVPLGITRESQGLTPDQSLGFPDMRLIVGAIESNHVMVPVALPALKLILNPSTLTFNANLGDANPGSQNLSVYQTGGGTVNWTAAVATKDGGTWLSVTPSTGADVGTISVSVAITGLAVGTYTGTVTVTGDAASNPPQVVTVTLVVGPALQLSPAALSFSANLGDTNPATQTVKIAKPAGNTTAINWTVAAASTSGKWLSVDMASGTDAGTLTVSVDITGLSAGTYTGQITVKSDFPGDPAQTVPVTLVIQPALQLSPAVLSFSANVGGANPAGRNVMISKPVANTGAINWTAVAASTGNWLFVSPASGTDAGSLGVSVIITGLGVGTYTGTITLTSNASGDVPQTVAVTLVINPALQLLPAALDYFARVGGPNPAGQTVTIAKATANTSVIRWIAAAASAGNWLSVSPAAGTDAGSLGVSVNIGGLAVGTYTGTIAVSTDFAGDRPQTLPVTLVISPALELSRATLNFSARLGDANPAGQTITIGNVNAINWTATATSTGNWLSVSPASGAGTGPLTASVNLKGLGVGTYTGKITVTSSAAGDLPQSVAVTLVIGPSLQLSRGTLSYSANLGDPNPAAQTVTIAKSAAGASTINWTAAATSTGGNWLSVSPASGMDAGTLNVTVDITGLGVGTYTGKITLTTDVPGDPPQTVTVTLVVKPALQITPAVLNYSATVGGSNPADQTVGIAKSTANTNSINWTTAAATSTGTGWLSVSPASGTDAGSLTVSVNITGLAAGTYTGKITVTSSVSGDPPQTVTVNLTVTSSSANQP